MVSGKRFPIRKIVPLRDPFLTVSPAAARCDHRGDFGSRQTRPAPHTGAGCHRAGPPLPPAALFAALRSRLPGLAERPSSGCGCAPDRTLTQGDPTTRGGWGRSLVPRELGTRYLGRRGICAVPAVGGAHVRA